MISNDSRSWVPDGLHVDAFGNGPRLLLVHGSHWQHPSKNFIFQRDLGNAFEVVIPHRPKLNAAVLSVRWISTNLNLERSNPIFAWLRAVKR